MHGDGGGATSEAREERPTSPSKERMRTEIEEALSLLEGNPAVSAEVVQTIRDMYTTHSKNVPSGKPPTESSGSGFQVSEGSSSQVVAKMEPDSGEESEDESHPSAASEGKRLHLTEEQVIEIYNMRPQYGKQGRLRRGSMLRCKTIAPKYGVTPKTIRDIWCGRTWPQTTEHLWTEDEKASRLASRKADSLRSSNVKQALEDLRVSFLTPAQAQAKPGDFIPTIPFSRPLPSQVQASAQRVSRKFPDALESLFRPDSTTGHPKPGAEAASASTDSVPSSPKPSPQSQQAAKSLLPPLRYGIPSASSSQDDIRSSFLTSPLATAEPPHSATHRPSFAPHSIFSIVAARSAEFAGAGSNADPATQASPAAGGGGSGLWGPPNESPRSVMPSLPPLRLEPTALPPAAARRPSLPLGGDPFPTPHVATAAGILPGAGRAASPHGQDMSTLARLFPGRTPPPLPRTFTPAASPAADAEGAGKAFNAGGGGGGGGGEGAAGR